MLVKFFPRGKGRGTGPVEYITRPDDPITKEPREPLPEVLRGDPEITANLIDSLDFQHKYTSGVLSFAPEDAPTAAQIEGIMDSFEEYAFAGLEPDRYNILWVKHSHTGSERVELHFVIPKVELTTGKQLNIAPPGWPNYFSCWRDLWNYQQGWARPDDPARARLYHPGREAFQEAQNRRSGQSDRQTTKQLIGEYLRGEIEAGKITNRAEIIASLKEVGLEITRAGDNYITVIDQETNQRMRLKGGIYEKTWRPRPENTAENRREPERDRIAKAAAIRIAQERISTNFSKRAEQFQERYPPIRTNSSQMPARDLRGGNPTDPVRQENPGLVLSSPGLPNIDTRPRFLRRNLGMDTIRLEPDQSNAPTAAIPVPGNREPTKERPTAAGKDLGSRTDGDRQRQVRSAARDHERRSQMDLWRSTLHEAGGIAHERARTQTERSLESASRSVQTGHEAASRAEQSATAASQQFEDAASRAEQSTTAANEHLERANREINQRLRQLNQNLKRVRQLRKRQLEAELERFKTEINLVEYAQAQGYEYERQKSSRQSAVLEHPMGDKIVVTTDRDGHGIYFSLRNEQDNGTIIDFLQNRSNLNLGQVRKELRSWSSSGQAPIPKPEPSARPRQEIIKAIATAQVARQHPYLEQRSISTATLQSQRFRGTVLIDERGNAIFPHQDYDRVTGYEIRNHNFKGFSRGGQKSLWQSNFQPGDNRLLVVESPIDALSHQELCQEQRTRYVATGGNLSQQQRQIFKAMLVSTASLGIEIAIGTDTDAPGNKLAQEIAQLIPGKCLRVTPTAQVKDWNEALQAEKKRQQQEQIARERERQRGRGFSL